MPETVFRTENPVVTKSKKDEEEGENHSIPLEIIKPTELVESLKKLCHPQLGSAISRWHLFTHTP